MNIQAFNGDYLILEEFKKLVKEHKVDLIVETGTYLGQTTAALANLAEVFTYENNADYMDKAALFLNTQPLTHTIRAIFGNSASEMKKTLVYRKNDKILFFLDAHWYDYCPLLDELKIIADLGIKKPIITIHDFYVPGKEFGFDEYKGQRFDWEFIKPSIERIYGKEGFKYYYNEKAEGAKRGIIFILPV
jgi:hypothetical protein